MRASVKLEFVNSPGQFMSGCRARSIAGQGSTLGTMARRRGQGDLKPSGVEHLRVTLAGRK